MFLCLQILYHFGDIEISFNNLYNSNNSFVFGDINGDNIEDIVIGFDYYRFLSYEEKNSNDDDSIS